MRVLFVSHTARVAGAEHSLLELLRGLPGDMEVTVACPAGALSEAVEELGIPTREIPKTDGSLKLHPVHTGRAMVEIASAGLRVAKIAREERADLLHANSVRAGLIVSVARARGAPPAVAHVRDCPPRSRVADATQKVVARRTELVVANSTYAADHFRDASGGGRVRVAYSPVDVERFDPAAHDRARSREALGIEPSAFVVALVGNITPLKGQDLAIRAVAALREGDVPDARLLLVGSATFSSPATRLDNTAFLEQLRSEVESLGLNGSVSFLGERDDVPEVLAAADVAVAPTWKEAFGRAIVEAMAMGLPVVATNVGGPREIVTEGVDGLLVPPKDLDAWVAALERLAADAELRARLGQAGRDRARQFDVKSHVDRVLAAYAEALAGTPVA